MTNTTAKPRQLVVRPQVGLLLSIGEPPTGQRNHPTKLDHFRPKPGSEQQYAPAVEKFREIYGDAPKVLDVVLLSNTIDDVLDIRWKAWGASGLKAVGKTNYALAPERLLDADDELITFPDDQREPGSYQMQGPDDPNIEKTGLKLYGVFRFSLHRVTGLSTLAEISTTSKRSMMNLLTGIQQVLLITGGKVAGIPFELAVRPARTRYFDEKKSKRASTTFFELVFQTPYSIDEFFDQVQLRRQLHGGAPLALPPVRHDDAERDRELAPGLWRSSEEQVIEDVVSDLPLVNSAPEPDEGVDRAGAMESGKPRPEDSLFPIPAKAHEDRG